MKSFSKVKYHIVFTYIESVYAFAFLLTGSRIAAEKITIDAVIESCHSIIYTVSLERCLYAAYHKGADDCLSCGYVIHDQLSRMLSKLTYIERGLVLLRYRYHMPDKAICRIVRKKQQEVNDLMKKALEKMMKDNRDGYMCVSECETAEHIPD